jgi:hypothetical protein
MKTLTKCFYILLQPIPECELLWKKSGYNPYAQFRKRGNNDYDNDPLRDLAPQIANQIRRLSHSADEINKSMSRRRRASTKERRARRSHKLYQLSLQESKFKCWTPVDVIQRVSWHAHSDCITSLEVLHNPNIVISASFDFKVYVWDWGGQLLGELGGSEHYFRPPWKFSHSDEESAKAYDEMVSSIIERLDNHTLCSSNTKARSNDKITENRILRHIIHMSREPQKGKQAVPSSLKHSNSLSQLEPRYCTQNEVSSDGGSENTVKPQDFSSVESIIRATSSQKLGPSKVERDEIYSKYISAYKNYSKLLNEREQRMENFRSKIVDAAPSPFLKSRLQFDDCGHVIPVRIYTLFRVIFQL